MEATGERKPRRWPLGLLVGLLTAAAAALAVAPVADWVLEMHDVSQREGGRACAVVALWMPAGAVVGFVIGFVATLLVRRRGFVGYLIPQGLALIAVLILIAAAAGVGYATAIHPPLLDGKELALDIELRVPAKGRTVQDLKTQNLTVALLAEGEGSYADMRWNEATPTNDVIVVGAWAPLKSSDAGRQISVGLGAEDRQLFSVMRAASPKKIDAAWSEWAPPRTTFSGKLPPPNEQYRVRYRVRLASEYSPPASETPAPDSASEENKSPASSASLTPDPQHTWSPPDDWLDRGLIPPSPRPSETPQP